MGYGHLRETETQKIVMVPGRRLTIQVPSGGPHHPLFDFHPHQLMTLVKPKSIPKNYGMRFFRLLFKNWCGHRELNPGRSSGRRAICHSTTCVLLLGFWSFLVILFCLWSALLFQSSLEIFFLRQRFWPIIASLGSALRAGLMRL